MFHSNHGPVSDSFETNGQHFPIPLHLTHPLREFPLEFGNGGGSNNFCVVDRNNLPCVQDIIAKRRNSLFGHVVRLDDNTPAHRPLSQVAAARTGSRFGPDWRRRPGRPRHSWIQQIGDGTPFSIRAEWSKARRRGHSGLTQRTSAVYAI